MNSIILVRFITLQWHAPLMEYSGPAELTRSSVSQLSTDHSSVIGAPGVVTHGTPHRVTAHFHSPLVDQRAAHQPQVPIIAARVCVKTQYAIKYIKLIIHNSTSLYIKRNTQ